MTKEEVHARIEEIGIVPAVRTSSADDARFAAEAVSRGGIPIVEIAMTVPGALEVISSLGRTSQTCSSAREAYWTLKPPAAAFEPGGAISYLDETR